MPQTPEIIVYDSAERSRLSISQSELERYVQTNQDLIEEALNSGANRVDIFIERERALYRDGCTGFVAHFDKCRLDVLWAAGGYGTERGEFEIHLLDENGNHIYPSGTKFERDVLGFQSKEEAMDIIHEYSSYGKEQVMQQEQRRDAEIEARLLSETPEVRLFRSDGPYCSDSFYSFENEAMIPATVTLYETLNPNTNKEHASIVIAFEDEGKDISAKDIAFFLWGIMATGTDRIAESPLDREMTEHDLYRAATLVRLLEIYHERPENLVHLEYTAPQKLHINSFVKEEMKQTENGYTYSGYIVPEHKSMVEDTIRTCAERANVEQPVAIHYTTADSYLQVIHIMQDNLQSHASELSNAEFKLLSNQIKSVKEEFVERFPLNETARSFAKEMSRQDLVQPDGKE